MENLNEITVRDLFDDYIFDISSKVSRICLLIKIIENDYLDTFPLFLEINNSNSTEYVKENFNDIQTLIETIKEIASDTKRKVEEVDSIKLSQIRCV